MDAAPALLSDPLLTKSQVAAALGVTARSIETLHRTGRLRGFVILGRLRWRRSAVEQFAQDAEAEYREAG